MTPSEIARTTQGSTELGLSCANIDEMLLDRYDNGIIGEGIIGNGGITIGGIKFDLDD